MSLCDFSNDAVQLHPKVSSLAKTHVVCQVLDNFPMYLAVERHPHATKRDINALSCTSYLTWRYAWSRVPEPARDVILQWFSTDWNYSGKRVHGPADTGWRARRCQSPWGLVQVHCTKPDAYSWQDVHLDGHVIHIRGCAFRTLAAPDVHGHRNHRSDWRDISDLLLHTLAAAAQAMLQGARYGSEDSSCATGLETTPLALLWMDTKARAKWDRERADFVAKLDAVRRIAGLG